MRSITGSNVNPFTMQRAVKILNSAGDLSEIIKYISSDPKSFLKAAYIIQ